MHSNIPERYIWAVDVLDVQPGDVILEIGCGYGHSVPLICDKIVDGHLTAIDRSVKMAEAAARANAPYITEGKAKVVFTELLDADLNDSYFDKIFLFNINVFWMDPSDELIAIRRLLKPDGRFYIFHQPPPGHDLREFRDAISKNLEENDFAVLETIFNEETDVRSLCVMSRPINRR